MNPSSAQTRCRGCRMVSTKDDIWLCVQCRGTWCDSCWDEIPAHNSNLEDDYFSFDAEESVVIGAHEKVSKEVYTRLSRLFAPLTTDHSRRRAHETELQAKWFGVNRGEGNQLYFGDTNRLTSIINDSWTAEYPDQYPSIVSFVGQTGAGKSTLIRALLTLQQHLAGRDGEEFLFPIPGRPGDPDPTTGDVHLYPDPGTQWGLTPLLFADCEGLDAGDKTPAALTASATDGGRVRAFRTRAKQKITWASGSKQLRRDEVVKRLFPRILYTISNTVVFVLGQRAARTLEKVVADHLIPWAAKSIYSSLNQAVQPHIIIVINEEDISVVEKEPGHVASTNRYMESLRTSFENDKNLNEIVQSLDPKTAASLQTHADLLEHLYSSVTFINIPQKAYLMKMDTQLRTLYDVIKAKSLESHRRREESRVLLKAERLERVLAAAFEHFSQGTDEPFNFLSESLWESPLPGGLGDNILRFFRACQRSVQDQAFSSQHDAAKLFRLMTPMLASHIFLDLERYDRFGNILDCATQIYSPPLRKAFEVFCETSLHCAFQRRSDNARCCNVKSNHNEKGHQGADGKPLGKGEFQYQPGFDPIRFLKEWESEIYDKMRGLFNDAKAMKEREQGLGVSRESLAAKIHRQQISSFLSDLDVSEFLDHRICLCCLRHSMPEYAMPCGKLLCSACMVSLRTLPRETSDRYPMRISTRCPFHPDNDEDCSLEADEKPRGAGVRILCLDGGGVRGIVQLAFLKAIQDQLGSHLNIQWFFDLVVGTSTGGIIALNLFVKNRPLEQCIKDFKTLCNRAFSPRELRSVPILGKLAMINHGSVFKTRPFESVLQSSETLGKDDLLFGGRGNSRPRWHARVAVTTTDQTSKQRPAILANYNRPEEEPRSGGTHSSAVASAPYDFVREARPCSEMKIWEAARATSAAFPYFKAFFKGEVKREFVDGALYHNCPVKIAIHEKRLLWPDVRMDDPDILLSLGTGKGHPTLDNSVFQPTAGRIGRRGIIAKSWELTAGLLENVFAGDSTWFEFLREATERHRKPELVREYTSRYIRLNIDIPGVVPKLYMADKVNDLEALVRNTGVPNAKEIAHRLVASSFYLRLVSAEAIEQDSQDCIRVKGTIECRFRDDPTKLKGLGRFLGKFLKPGSDFSPSFVVETDFDPKRRTVAQPLPDDVREINADVVKEMCEKGTFTLPSIELTGERSTFFRLAIRLERQPDYSHDDPYLSISGMPRRLEAKEIEDEFRANRKDFGGWSPTTWNGAAPPPPYEAAVKQGGGFVPTWKVGL